MAKAFILTADVLETARFTLSGICGFEFDTKTTRKVLQAAQRVAPDMPPVDHVAMPREADRRVELTDKCFNVAFDGPTGETQLHLGMNVSFERAQEYVKRFSEEYVGKPYPNGKGHYAFTNPRVVLLPPTPGLAGLTDLIKRIADTPIWRDTYPDGPDTMDGDYRITPADVRACRAALASSEGRE